MAIKKIYIYFCGSVKKSKDDDNTIYWTEDDFKYLQNLLPNFDIRILDPNNSFVTLDRRAKFGRDIFQVSISNFLIFDGREKRGIGAGVELAFARINNIPIISFLPDSSHYRKKNIDIKDKHFTEWIHPFVKEMSNSLCYSIDEIANFISEHIKNSNNKEEKDVFMNAIAYYKRYFLENDNYMRAQIKDK